MAKAFEVKTGLDKLICWAKGTKYHVDNSRYLPVNGESILTSVDWVNLRDLSRQLAVASL